MKSLIFIAPPAAGKGTQAKMVSEAYDLAHISTGDLLREEVKNGNTELQEIMESGKLVSDEIVLDLLTKKISSLENGYILDGFPRNVNQAISFDKMLTLMNQKIDYVIYLNLDKEIAKKRIVGRVSCPNCGNVYNTMIEGMEPKEEDLCNNCHTTLTKRKDDNEETFEVRYNTYLEETEPLIKYYQDKNILYEIDSSLEKQEVFERIKEIIND